MKAYRLSGKVSPDRTIAVQVPEASVGEEAEVIVLFPQSASARLKAQNDSFEAFFKMLDESPPKKKGSAEDDHVLLRQSRDEWD